MDPPEEKRNSDQPEKTQNWGRPVTEAVDFFSNLLLIVCTTFFFALICWVFDAFSDGLESLERYVLPEYEVLPPPIKPLSPAEYEGLALRIQEAARRSLQELAERESQMPIHQRTSSRAQRRNRPYNQQETRNTPDRESPSEINVGASTSGQSTAGEIVREDGAGSPGLQPPAGLNSSQKLQGSDKKQSPPLSPSQSQLSDGLFWETHSFLGDQGHETGLSIDTSSQQLELPSLKKFLTGPPTDSSTSSSGITTDSNEQSSDETFGTGKDLPTQEPPLSPGISVDAGTTHLSGGAVWEAPSPPQSPPLFSEDDFAKLTSGLPVVPGSEELDRGNSQLSSSLMTGSVSETAVLSPVHKPMVFSQEDFDRLTGNQKLPGTSGSASPPLSPEINLDASTSHLTGGSVLDTSPPPVSSPPLFSQDDFEKMMVDLSVPSALEKTEQEDSPSSSGIAGFTSSHLSGGSVMETESSPVSSPPPEFPEGDSARTASPRRYPTFCKFGETTSQDGTLRRRGSNSFPSSLEITSGVCVAEQPAEAESFSELSERRSRHYSRSMRTSMPYVSLSDDDEPAIRQRSWFEEETVRASSMEDLRSEASKHRRLKFRRRSMPLGEAVPRSTRIVNLLDRMDLQVTKEKLQRIKIQWSPQSSPRRYPNNQGGDLTNLPR